MKEMKTEGIEPNVVTYTALIKGYCQDGDLKVAISLLDECEVRKAMAEKAGDKTAAGELQPNLRTFSTLLRGCMRNANGDEALLLWHRLTVLDIPSIQRPDMLTNMICSPTAG